MHMKELDTKKHTYTKLTQCTCRVEKHATELFFILNFCKKMPVEFFV